MTYNVFGRTLNLAQSIVFVVICLPSAAVVHATETILSVALTVSKAKHYVSNL